MIQQNIIENNYATNANRTDNHQGLQSVQLLLRLIYDILYLFGRNSGQNKYKTDTSFLWNNIMNIKLRKTVR